MTGYSKVAISEDGLAISCEIKSLNGRNLELNAKMPRTLNSKEFEIRDIVKENIARGSVSMFINIERENVKSEFDINKDIANEVFAKLNDLKKTLKIKETVTLSDLLAFSNQFVQKTDEQLEIDLHWKSIQKCVKESLKEHDKMRRKEGGNIQKDIEKRVKNIQDILKNIEISSATRVQTEIDKLRQRIAVLLENDEIDDQRLNMELVLMADKYDISEECVRLHSHIKHFFDIVKENNPVGQKLNFLLQEMNREVNTIGSKINDASIAHMVVSAKEEIERIREQVQNIE
jgi:uncharacterized protein (TIGR00255 family)